LLGEPKPGTKFFVYGFRGKDSKLYIEACSRTAGLEFAAADVRYARNEPATKEDLAPPGERMRLLLDPTLATSGAVLRGKVTRADGADVSDVYVTIWRVDDKGFRENYMEATQRVEKDGSYEIRYLPAGRYLGTAEDSILTKTARFVGVSENFSLDQGQSLDLAGLVLRAEPLGRVSVQVHCDPGLRDRIFVWLRDVDMDARGGPAYRYAQTANLDTKNVASFEYVPYGRYDVDVLFTGEDAMHPPWTHDPVQVELKGSSAEAEVTLRKSDQQ
jgi:hypothetical protein